MRTTEQKLDSLGVNDAWVFTKQNADFDEAFRMTQLFSEMPDAGNVSIQQYFSDNYRRYGISENNYRALIIPQLFGLLTKTTFFKRGAGYEKERPTAVFRELRKYGPGSYEYNTIKTEQLLKIRMKAITSVTDYGFDRSVFPFIFSFGVLWELRRRGVGSISFYQFCTYVMTCKTFDELGEAVALLESDPAPSQWAAKYADLSRIRVLFGDNSRLIRFSGSRGNCRVSLDDDFADYFHRTFYSVLTPDRMKTELELGNYADFLYNIQGFGINLIDIPAVAAQPVGEKPDEKDEYRDGDHDGDYLTLVDNVGEEDIADPDFGAGAHARQPRYAGTGGGENVATDPALGKKAIVDSGYKCSADAGHRTFRSKITDRDFMEAHHLIPVRYTRQMWDRFGVNIDCLENLVPLCPNCHRAVHYGSLRVKDGLLRQLYNIKQKQLTGTGIDISIDELLGMYP